jgi:hypothetical protein
MGNNDVRHHGHVLYFKNWINAGLIHLKDIVVNDRFINLSELSNVIMSPLNLFNLHKLIASIPKVWKNKVKHKGVSSSARKSKTFVKFKGKTLNLISGVITKQIYTILNTRFETPSCTKYWERYNICDKSWNYIFRFKIKNRNGTFSI